MEASRLRSFHYTAHTVCTLACIMRTSVSDVCLTTSRFQNRVHEESGTLATLDAAAAVVVVVVVVVGGGGGGVVAISSMEQNPS